MSEAYVIDPSVLIQAFVTEPDSGRVETLLARLVDADPVRLHCPEFCLLECANILWKQVRFNHMPLVHAQESIAELRILPLIIHPAVGLLSRAVEMGMAHHLAVYDSVYMALAEALDIPLLTADLRQMNAARALGVATKSPGEFPVYVERAHDADD